MEIGGLGFFNTVASTVKDSSQGSGNSAFQGLWGQLIADSSQSVEGKLDDTQLSRISKEELLDLIQLLKAEDILTIDKGMELFNESLSLNGNEELVSLIQEKVIKGVKIEDLIQQIQLDLDLPIESIIGYEAKITETSTEEASKITEEQILLVLNQILSLSMKDLNSALTGKVVDLLKAVKQFDLLSENGSYLNNKELLKDLIQQLTKKLESLVENGGKDTSHSTDKQNARMEYLSKSFTALATELNRNTSEQKPTSVKIESVNGLVHFQQISKAEQLIMTLSQSGKPTNSAELIKQFENILAKSQFSNIAGSQKLLIKLNPEHLGALRIELIQRDAGIVAKIMTTTQVAKETLETHLNGLKQAFGSQNIQVDKVEVSQAMSQQQERFLSRDQGQQSQQQEHSQKEAELGENDAGDDSFNVSLEEALVNAEA